MALHTKILTGPSTQTGSTFARFFRPKTRTALTFPRDPGNEPALLRADQLPLVTDGFLNVVAHEDTSILDLANFIAGSPEFAERGIRGVRLISCEGCSSGLAQEIANRLRVTVLSPTTLVAIDRGQVVRAVELPNGEFRSAGPAKFISVYPELRPGDMFGFPRL